MNTLLQPGNHPDADQLSAFAEHALTPHEQQQTLAHLATCAACRNLVYLTQQAAPIELTQPQPVAARRPWFASWNLALPAALALACLILFTIHLHNITTTSKPTAPTTTASVEPPPPTISSTPEPTLKPAAPISTQAAAPKPAHALDKKQSPLIVIAPQTASAVPRPSPAPVGAAMTGASFAGLSFRPQFPSGAIDGRITDPSGAIVPRAKITATNTDTGVAITRESTATGSFSIASLQPGNYNVEAVAPGFQRLLQENVHVEPTQELALNMKLNVGAANQTVTVTDAPPSLDTTNASLGGTIENELYTQLPLTTAGKAKYADPSQAMMATAQRAAAAAPSPAVPPPPAPPQSAQQNVAQQGVYGGTGQTNLNENYIAGVPTRATGSAVAGAAPATATATASDQVTLAAPQLNLPSHLPALSTITRARQVLAIDGAGALFRSEDAGVTWLPVTSQWQGRATRVALAHPPVATDQLARKSVATLAAKPAATPPPLFELTTDTNITYTSPNGQTWRRK
jgi:hypothetical protein